MVAGFIKPDAGSVTFEKAITGMKPNKICDAGIVRTFQVTQPFASPTTLENIMVGAYHQTANRAQAEEIARAVAEQVGMTPMLEQALAADVAGRKRSELARTLVPDRAHCCWTR